MVLSYSIWKDCQDTIRSTEEYILFYQGEPIDHRAHVPGPVAKSSAKSEYNAERNTGMGLSHFRMLNYKLLNKYPDVVREQEPLITLDRKPAICITNNGKDTKHTRHVSRRMYLVLNGEE